MLRFVSIATALVCAANLCMAAPPPPRAMVYGGPTVTVSKTVVSGRLVAFPGDLVETHDEHSAQVTLPGTSVVLSGNSSARFNGTSFELLSGGIQVTSGEFGVTTSCYSVRTRSADSRFVISSYQGRTYVQASTGDIELKTGNKTQVMHSKTVAITGCGTKSISVQEVGGSNFLPKAIFGGAAAGAIAVPQLLPRKQVSAGAPNDHP